MIKRKKTRMNKTLYTDNSGMSHANPTINLCELRRERQFILGNEPRETHNKPL